MVKYAILVGIYFICFNCLSGDQRGLYGVDPYPYGPSLVKYDVESGTQTVIAGSNGGYTSPSVHCFDDINNILYYVVGIFRDRKTFVSGLYGWNLSHPSESPGFIELPQIYAYPGSSPASSGQQCVGGSNGTVYFWGHSAANISQLLLLKIYRNESNDLVIDTLAVYSDINNYESFGGSFPSPVFDSKRNKFWMAGFKNSEVYKRKENYTEYYFYIDASTGSIENKILMKNWPIDSPGYDAEIDMIVGLHFVDFEPDENAEYVLKYADPITLEVYKTSRLFKEWCYDGAGTIDNDNQIWYQFIYNGTAKRSNESVVCEKAVKENNYIVGFNLTSAQILDMAVYNTTWDSTIWDLFYWDGK